MSAVIKTPIHARADEPTELAQAVQRALLELNATTLVERQAAERRLIELGPKVLPHLPALDLVTAVSAKQAIKRVRQQLEVTAAKQSIVSSQLTLDGRFTVNELTTEFQQQSRNQIRLPAQNAPTTPKMFPTVRVKWSQRPFWEAVQDLETQQLSIDFNSQRSAYEWATRLPTTPRDATQVLGAFRISAAPLEARRPNDDGTHLLNAQLTIAAEPRLRPLILRYRAADFALGADGSIPPFDPDARIELPLSDGGRISQFSIPFLSRGKLPESVPLKGQVKLVVAAGEEPIEFKEFGRSAGVSRRHGGVTVTLTQVRFKRQDNARFGAEVRLQISYDSAQHAFESHQLWVFHNHVYLKNAQGEPLAHTGGAETLFQQNGVVGVEYRFEDLPDAARLWSCTYVAPTLLIEVPLEFKLPPIPLRRSND